MRNIWTFARREYHHYFISPIAYVVAIIVLLIVGYLFSANISYYSAQALYSGSSAPDVSVVVLPLSTVFLLTIPALSMRLLAEEQRMGTMELLLTAPVKDWELVIGKWLGAFLFTLTIIAATFLFPIVLNKLVTPGIDQGIMLACYLAIILLAASYLAIGTAFSAIFKNQFVAFFVTMIALMVLWWLIHIFTIIVTVTPVNNILNYLDLNGHFNNMIAGKVSLADIIYPLSLTALGLFLGTIVVEIRRWQ